jgi:hypothetical protein
MKPTAKQIAIMELVRSHLSAATRSNDFSSPTVISDFDEDLYVEHFKSDFELPLGKFMGVSEAFNNLINSIRHIK